MQMSLASKSQPVQWTENPNVLLLATGILLGLTFPLAKIAGQEGIPAASWIMMNSFGVCIALLPALFFSGTLALPNKRHIKYLTISGSVTFAAPNLLIFLVIPHVGAGYSGIMFALSPIITAIFSYLLGINTLNRLHIAGITLGLSGALSMSLTKSFDMPQASYIWLLLALMIPFLLATGNIYRTLAWPSNASPDSLAFGVMPSRFQSILF